MLFLREPLVSEISSVGLTLAAKKFSVASLREQLDQKKTIVESVESFLMTHRGDHDIEAFAANSRELASQTLAHALATEEQQIQLADVFELVARHIEASVPDIQDQTRFGRTLLGVDQALVVEQWVGANRELLAAVPAEELFAVLWPLLSRLSAQKRLIDSTPAGTMLALGEGWLAGKPYSELLLGLNDRDSSYAYGAKRRRFDIDVVVDVCEQTFGFEFTLFVAAINSSYAATGAENAESFSADMDPLQKRLRYGLPNTESIYYFEAGFADRVIAQSLALGVFWDSPTNVSDVRRIVRESPHDFLSLLDDFPSYFRATFQNMIDSAPQST